MTTTFDERQRILLYSRDKFFNEGFYRITMDELARDLRISKKTIYKHFPSKEHLVREISDNVINIVQIEIDKIIDQDINIVIKFRKMIELYHLNTKVDNKWYRDLQLHTPDVWVNIEKFRAEKIISTMTKLLKQGKREKLVEDYPNEIIISVFNAAIKDIINPDFIIRNKFSMKQAVSYTLNMLLNSILTPAGKEQYKKLA